MTNNEVKFVLSELERLSFSTLFYLDLCDIFEVTDFQSRLHYFFLVGGSIIFYIASFNCF